MAPSAAVRASQQRGAQPLSTTSSPFSTRTRGASELRFPSIGETERKICFPAARAEEASRDIRPAQTDGGGAPAANASQGTP